MNFFIFSGNGCVHDIKLSFVSPLPYRQLQLRCTCRRSHVNDYVENGIYEKIIHLISASSWFFQSHR